MRSLSISTIVPSFRLALELRPPSSSSTCALLSSKRTPLTMIEPKPVIGPTASVGGVLPVPVPPLSTPPPQPPSAASAASVARES